MKEFKKNFDQILAVLVVVNILLLVYVAFIKKDSVWLETMKSGGAENFELVQQIYGNEAYKSQQSNAIKQALTQFGSQPSVQQPTVNVQPTVEVQPSQPTQ